jgi:hypothetical protein
MMIIKGQAVNWQTKHSVFLRQLTIPQSAAFGLLSRSLPLRGTKPKA